MVAYPFYIEGEVHFDKVTLVNNSTKLAVDRINKQMQKMNN